MGSNGILKDKGEGMSEKLTMRWDDPRIEAHGETGNGRGKIRYPLRLRTSRYCPGSLYVRRQGRKGHRKGKHLEVDAAEFRQQNDWSI